MHLDPVDPEPPCPRLPPRPPPGSSCVAQEGVDDNGCPTLAIACPGMCESITELFAFHTRVENACSLLKVQGSSTVNQWEPGRASPNML